MFTTKTSPASQAPTPQPTSQTNLPLTPSPETIRSKFDLGISLSLSLYPVLSLAIRENWGGPPSLSLEKRDWFAGAISSLFETRPDTDAEDVEAMILQVMNDEFEVNVEDGSAWEVAVGIMRLRKECGEGRFGGVDELWERWVEKGGKGVEGVFRKVEVPEGEEEWDSEEDGEEDGEGEDVDMEEAPALVETKEKIVREVDDEGFTKVVGKKRR